MAKERKIQTFVCGKCGRTIRGNGYFLHASRCKVEGPTVQLVSPIEIPQGSHERFVALCKRRGEAQMDAVRRLIIQEVQSDVGEEEAREGPRETEPR